MPPELIDLHFSLKFKKDKENVCIAKFNGFVQENIELTSLESAIARTSVLVGTLLSLLTHKHELLFQLLDICIL